MTWSTDYKPIVDTSQQVEEEIETGFEMDKNYIVIVTVMSDYGNFTSKGSFSKSKHTWLSLQCVHFKGSGIRTRVHHTGCYLYCLESYMDLI